MANNPVDFPAGNSGSSGGGAPTSDANLIEVVTDFSYSSVSPLTIKASAANEFINKIRVCIDTAFNGSPATLLTMGSPGNIDILMLSSDVNTASTGIYEIWVEYLYAGVQDINLYITLNGATQGSGRIILVSSK